MSFCSFINRTSTTTTTNTSTAGPIINSDNTNNNSNNSNKPSNDQTDLAMNHHHHHLKIDSTNLNATPIKNGLISLTTNNKNPITTATPLVSLISTTQQPGANSTFPSNFFLNIQLKN